MENRKLKRLVVSALLAAVYCVLALALPMASFGPVQFRVSEALTVLPVFSPGAAIGVTLGCFLTNCAGVLMGVTFPQDILFGTFATLVGCVFTWLFRGVRIKGLPVLSALAPVVCNTIIIGWEINAFFLDTPSLVGFVTSALGVGLGELAACCGLGLLLVVLLERTGLDKHFRDIPQGGSRKGTLRTYWNIMLTFLVSGIWHGANWTFILWGLIHGFAQCVEKSLGLNRDIQKISKQLFDSLIDIL